MTERPRKRQLPNILKYPSNAEGCYFCSEKNPDALDWHHILPFHGIFLDSENEAANMKIHLCANCHRKLHRTLEPVQDFFNLVGFDTKTQKAKGQLRITFLVLSLLEKGKTIEDLAKMGFPENVIRATVTFLEKLGLLKENRMGHIQWWLRIDARIPFFFCSTFFVRMFVLEKTYRAEAL